MYRALLTITVGIVLSLLIAQAQTIDEIIDKNIQAHGGLKKLKEVETIRQTGRLTIGGFRASFVQENKRPNRVREETTIQGMSEVTVYDGKAGWHVSPFSGRKDPELLSEDDLKPLLEDADIDGQLTDYRRKGHKAELTGHDSVEGTDCYKIKLTMKNGDIRYYYLDIDSFLELKIETERMIRGAVEYRDTIYGDYEEVNGLYFPFAFESGEKGDPNRLTARVDKIEINVPLTDHRFSMSAGNPNTTAAGAAK
jgi:outer membrane lipoprotein-sorting protein